jgi:hypothetical protein
MFQKIARIAKVFDDDGRYIEADVLTLAMRRLAEVVDEEKRKEREHAIKRHLDDLGEKEVIPGRTKDIDRAPKKKKEKDPDIQPVRPGLEKLMTPTEWAYPQGKKEVKIQRPSIELRDPDQREKYRDYFESEAANGDPYAERALEIIDMMEGMEEHPLSRPRVDPYGQYLIGTPAGARTIFEGPRGGKRNVTPFFQTREMGQENAANTLDFLQNIDKDEDGMARAMMQYYGSDQKSRKPEINNDVVINNALLSSLSPELRTLSELRKQKSEMEGKKFNTRPSKPGEFSTWHTDWLRKMDPNSSRFMKNPVYQILDSKIQEFMHDYGMNLDEATHYAIVSLIGEGKGGIGGVWTPRMEDTGAITKHDKSDDTRFFNLPESESGIRQKLEEEGFDPTQGDVGFPTDYSGVSPSDIDSTKDPILNYPEDVDFGEGWEGVP